MQVIMMIGLPRSGKSTWVENNHAQATVVSADHFFVDLDTGNYNFEPSKLSEAHAQCFRNFLRALVRNVHTVIVDNCNMTNWERAPYVLAAQAYGCSVQWVHMRVSADVCISRLDNGHGVPDASIQAKRENYEDPLPFWPGVSDIMKVYP